MGSQASPVPSLSPKRLQVRFLMDFWSTQDSIWESRGSQKDTTTTNKCDSRPLSENSPGKYRKTQMFRPSGHRVRMGFYGVKCKFSDFAKYKKTSKKHSKTMPKSSIWGAIWYLNTIIEHNSKNRRKYMKQVPPPVSETCPIFSFPCQG